MNEEGKKRILIADDNQDICELVEILLTAEGFEVVQAKNGQEAVDRTDNSIDLIILDVMMPQKSGYKACSEIREKTRVPILFLTAKDQDSDKVMGFSVGGDDYLSKPFSYTELVSRVKSLLRRYYVYQGSAPAEKSNRLVIRDLVLDKDAQNVEIGGEIVTLTDIEYRILELMMDNRKKVFSAQNIYESIWNEPYFYSANNTVMVHIRNLRKKLKDNSQEPQYIKTAWGKGYYVD
ncbi:DNA-binding response regulator, OmpR family, contains REC and winged-helix (wHTH) domain [Eubacterium maltosivorans]|uniref:response regulator transcription factor n=1 Tax=Eubacterium maltosivorans TaxID=2041044 RepID=UPI0008923209|nr:response regulator transcription factor [Eubacterium maltosivorans]WPK80602.1 Transcriptional regulatory protein WalR [Eubacterium maltosivorans]SDO23637.1 DNA-binding response regulator, OmpR family, contains REC and winged-helix (wHTH) domain [Eubacterium maltosivorans]